MQDIKLIPTILVNGFLESGKTTYIQDCLKNDFFYKRGSTLLILFEEGETEYDEELLRSRRTEAVACDSGEDITAFIEGLIADKQPDRVYIEMNAMTDRLREQLPNCLRVDFSITLIDGGTLALCYTNMRQLLQNMVMSSNQVIFNRCEVEALRPYGNAFRVMNNKAAYLWEAPQGYHEKAFGVMVPFDPDQAELQLSEEDFTPFYLDALAAPEHYAGKTVTFVCTAVRDEECDGSIRVGRQVMTCCLADVQFLSFPCVAAEGALPPGGWFRLTAKAVVRTDRYRRSFLMLELISAVGESTPEHTVIGL